MIEIRDKAINDFNTFFPEDMVPGLEYVFTSRSMKNWINACKIMTVDFIGKKYYEEKQKFNRGKHDYDEFIIRNFIFQGLHLM